MSTVYVLVKVETGDGEEGQEEYATELVEELLKLDVEKSAHKKKMMWVMGVCVDRSTINLD